MKNKDNSLLFGGGASNGYQTNYFFDTKTAKMCKKNMAQRKY